MQPPPLPLLGAGPLLPTTAGLLCCGVTEGEPPELGLTAGLGLADAGGWDATGTGAAVVGTGAGTEETCETWETWETCPPPPDTWDECDEWLT